MVRGYAAAQIDGSEGRAIDVPRRGRDPLRMDGQSYLFHFLLPNLFFHASIAYAILREAGMALNGTISSARTEAAGMDAVERRAQRLLPGILAAFMSRSSPPSSPSSIPASTPAIPRRWLLAWCLALPRPSSPPTCSGRWRGGWRAAARRVG